VFLLSGTFFTAISLSVHHYLQESPFILDLIIPPAVAIYLLGTLAYIVKYPSKISSVIQPLIFIGIFSLCLPAWYYSLLAFGSDQYTLLEVLPPITPIIFPLAMVIVTFLKPHLAIRTFLLTWIMFSAPILAYLMTHSSELSSLRGNCSDAWADYVLRYYDAISQSKFKAGSIKTIR
jgi:hypothetical protein